ncbi:MAG TPA: hypothetical protein VND23_06275, partial [Acidimicrobiales bacterium]|nr:hypothetical protein [Acidimicrobiales bacterium]
MTPGSGAGALPAGALPAGALATGALPAGGAIGPARTGVGLGPLFAAEATPLGTHRDRRCARARG